ncbi:MAG: hypothetical protein PHC95_00750 [Parabacteroides sp.]|nr:hypothetical protein [Parabacteroides sp.]
MKKYWLTFASVLMIVVGLLRGMGGVTLLIQGDKLDLGLPITASPEGLKIAAYSLIAVCCLLVISAICLTIRRYVANYAFCWISLLLFLIGGIVNGFLLFGHPLAGGQLMNWGISFVIGLLLVLGKDTVKSKHIQEYEYK